jgi:hypothetical protein
MSSKLYYGEHLLATIVPDSLWQGLFRIDFFRGPISDLGNLARIKDAAESIAERGPPPRNRQHLRWKPSETPLKAKGQAHRAIRGRP